MSRKLYEEILKQIPGFIAILHDDGMILKCSPDLNKFLGRSPESDDYYRDYLSISSVVLFEEITGNFIGNSQTFFIKFLVSHDVIFRVEVKSIYLDKNYWLLSHTEYSTCPPLLCSSTTKLFNCLIQNSFDIISFHNSDGQIVSVSRAVKNLTGFDPKSILNSNAMDYIHPNDVWKIKFNVGKFIISGENQRMNFRMKKIDGSYIWVESILSKVDGSSIHERQFFTITRDISKSVEDQCKLNESKQLIERQNRDLQNLSKVLEKSLAEAKAAFNAKSLFVAKMSHELRTPLNAVLGFSDLMNSEIYGPLGDPRYKRYVEDIYISGNHLLHLVNDVLDLSRIESGVVHLDIVPINPEILFDYINSHNSFSLEGKKIELITTVDHGVIITADQTALIQIIDNLVTNAIKYSPEKSEINVRVKYYDTLNVLIEIEDQGCGMADDQIERLMQPFEQMASAYQSSEYGVGLGLSIVKGLVDLHNGKFLIRSKVGEGTIIQIVLPIVMECL